MALSNGSGEAEAVLLGGFHEADFNARICCWDCCAGGGRLQYDRATQSNLTRGFKSCGQPVQTGAAFDGGELTGENGP